MNERNDVGLRRREFGLLGGAALAAGISAPSVTFAAEELSEADAMKFVSQSGINQPVSAVANSTVLLRMEHEAALMKLPHLYAQAIDRRDIRALDNLFTQDARFMKHDGDKRDRAGILNIPNVLRRTFTGTFHAIFNQTLVINDRTAVGEVYCLARHFFERDGRFYAHDMTFRYQDRYRLEQDNFWRFSLRHPILIADEPFNEVAPPLNHPAS